jgi:Zn-dependent protease
MPVAPFAFVPGTLLVAGSPDVASIVNTILALLIAIDLHELAHALVADRLGDDTPRRAGHISLNPFRHMDQFGILMLFLLAIVGQGFTYGYTPVDERALSRRTRFGPAIVALAGPATNLLLAFLVAIPLMHSSTPVLNGDGSLGMGVFGNAQLYDFLARFFLVNVFLGVFNLVPLPPLDGWTILAGFLTPRARFNLRGIVQYGPMILILLFLFEPQIHFFGSVIDPITNWVGTQMLTHV